MARGILTASTLALAAATANGLTATRSIKSGTNYFEFTLSDAASQSDLYIALPSCGGNNSYSVSCNDVVTPESLTGDSTLTGNTTIRACLVSGSFEVFQNTRTVQVPWFDTDGNTGTVDAPGCEPVAPLVCTPQEQTINGLDLECSNETVHLSLSASESSEYKSVTWSVQSGGSTLDATDKVITSASFPYSDLASMAQTHEFELCLKDENNLEVCCNHKFVVQDTTPPVIHHDSGTDEITVSCDDLPIPQTLTVTDNCAASYQINPDEPEDWTPSGTLTSNTGTKVYTYTATDGKGNSSVVSKTVVVADLSPPYFKDVPDITSAECGEVPEACTVTAFDNCTTTLGVVDVDETTEAGTTDCEYKVKRTWVAVDEDYQSTTVERIISVVDNTNPTLIGVPAESTQRVSCDVEDLANVLPVISATDKCDGSLTVTPETQDLTGNTREYLYVAEDKCGKKSTYTHTIEIYDDQAPVISGVDNNKTIEKQDGVNPLDLFCAPVVLDNCDDSVQLTPSDEEPTCDDNKCSCEYVRHWDAEDVNGQKASRQSQTITVIDNTPPSFAGTATPEGEFEVECDEVPVYDVLCEDVGSGKDDELSWQSSKTSENGVDTYVCADDCGKSITKTVNLKVVDNTPPQFFNVADNFTVDCSQLFDAFGDLYSEDSDLLSLIPSPVVVENCGSANVESTPTLTYTTDKDCRGNVCTLSVTFKATDNADRSTEVPVIATILDLTPPSWDLPLLEETASISCEEIEAESQLSMSATDDCAEILDTKELPVDDTIEALCDHNYTRVRTWTSTDPSGNANTFRRTVTVRDNSPPEFINPSELPQTRTFNTCNRTDELTTRESIGLALYNTELESIEFQDNCSADAYLDSVDGKYTNSDVSFTNKECNGDLKRDNTIRITDECGMYTEHTWTMTVTDSTSPNFTSDELSNETYESSTINTGQCDSPVPADDVTAEDACSLKTMNYQEQTLTQKSHCDYTLKRTWNPEDDCGNKANSREVIYTIIDDTPPVLTESVDTTRECDCHDLACIESGLGTKFTEKDHKWTDCCDTEIVGNSYFEEVFPEGSDERACNGTYVFKEIHTYTDASDNVGRTETLVTVTDTAPPSFGPGPEDKTLECLASYDSLLFVPTASDHCTEESAITRNKYEKSNSSKHHNAQSTYVYTAEDDCANDTTYEVVYSYYDTTPPVLTVENNTVECSVTNVPDVSSIDALVHSCSDECTTGMSQEVSITHTVAPATNSDDPKADQYLQKYEFTYTCTDVASLTHEQTATLTVSDTTPPFFKADDPNYKAEVTYDCDNIETPTLTYGDDCTADDDIYYRPITENTVTTPGDSEFEYTLTKTYRIEDESGNFTEYVQTVTIVDNEAPTLTVVANDNEYQCEYVDFESTDGTVTATDNCSADADITILLTEVSQNYVCDHDMEWVRTWTAIDQAGNQSSQVQTVTIKNEEDPTFDSTPANETKEWTYWSTFTLPTYTGKSACGAELTAVEVQNSNGKQLLNSCPTTYTKERTIELTDTCDRKKDHTWTETAIDTVAPYLEFTIDGTTTAKLGGKTTLDYTDTQECSEIGYDFDVFTPVVKSDDNQEVSYSSSITVSPSDLPLSVATNVLHEKHEQWVVSDCAGNKATYTRSETIEDNVPPTFEWETSGGISIDEPQSASYNCTHEVPADSIGVTAIYVDACSAKTVTATPYSSENQLKDRYENSWSYEESDSCGNSVSHSYTITVDDQVMPSYYWGEDGNDAAPTATTASSHAVPDFVKCQWGDNCVFPLDQKSDCTHEAQTISQETSSDYVVEHCYTMPDQNTQNPGQHCYQVTISDSAPPQLQGLPLEHVTVDENTAWPTPVPDVSCTDEMSPQGLTVVYVEEEIWHHELAEIRQFNMTRTWECTDISGNIAIFTQTLEVLDKVVSEFDCVPEGTEIICNSEGTQAKIDEATTLLTNSTGNCDWTPIDADRTINSLDISRPAADDKCEDDYKLVYTYTVYDVVNNSKTQTQTVKVTDITPPVFDETELQVIQDDIKTEPIDWCHYTGAKDLTAVDACENRPITVVRIPEVTYPSLTAVESLKGTDVHPDEGGFNYDIQYTFSAEDRCGNTSTFAYTDMIRDLTPPTFECGDSRTGENFCATTKTIECNGLTPPPGPDQYTADNGSYGSCDAMDSTGDYVKIETIPTNVASAASPSTSYAGCLDQPHTYTYRVRATDASGKFVEENHVYSYSDNVPPSLTVVPGSEAAQVADLAGDFNPTRDDISTYQPMMQCNDDCGTCAVTFGHSATTESNDTVDGGYSYVKEWVATWTATDQCNLTTSVVKTLTRVEDSSPPVFDSTPAQDYTAEAHKDNKCGGVYNRCLGLEGKKYCNAELGLCTNDEVFKGTSLFDTVESLSVTDAGFHETQTVSVDTANGGLELVSEGNCETVYKKTWIVSDNDGNSATHIQSITIEDTTPPVFDSTPGPWVFNCQEANNIQAKKDLTLTAYDLATNDVVNVDRDIVTKANCSDNDYELEYTYTATDTCGKKTTHVTTLTVKDEEDPEVTWTFQHTFESQCDPEAPQQADELATANFVLTDNCGSFAATNDQLWDYDQETLSQVDAHDYTIKRTWTFFDTDKAAECANQVSVSKTFTIHDTTAPVCQVTHDTLECDEELPAADNSTLDCTDNCIQTWGPDSKKVTATPVSTSLNDLDGENYEIIRTWEASDLSGETGSFTQTFTFLDRTPPTISVPDSVSVFAPDVSSVTIPAGATETEFYIPCKANTSVVATKLVAWVESQVQDACASTDDINAQQSTSYTPRDVTSEDSCSDADKWEFDFVFYDNNGNVSAKTLTVIAIDIVDPEWVSYSASQVNRIIAPENYNIYATVAEEANMISAFPHEKQVIITTTDTMDDCASNALDYTGHFSYNESSKSCHIATVSGFTVASSSGSTVYLASKVKVNNDDVVLNYTTHLVPGPRNAVDNCAGELTVQPAVTSDCTEDCSCENEIEWTYIAQDNCGNAITRTETKTARDNAAPKLVNVPESDEDNECSTINDDTWADQQFAVTATDNSDASVNVDRQSAQRVYTCGSDDENGSFSVEYTWTVSDVCGNTDESKRTFTHTDITPPVITVVQENYTIGCHEDLDYVKFKSVESCGQEVDIGNETGEIYKTIRFQDDASALGVGIQSIKDVQTTKSETEFTLYNEYVTEDACGNSTTHVQTITVEDNTPPTWISQSLPQSVNIQCKKDDVDDSNFYPLATDTCEFIKDVERTTETTDDYPLKENGETRVHNYFVKDNALNEITYKQTVTILDTTPPTFSVFTSVTTEECNAISQHPQPLYEDNCVDAGQESKISYVGTPDISTEAKKANGECIHNYYESTSYKITDESGNWTTATYSVYIRDTTPPEFQVSVVSETTVDIKDIHGTWPTTEVTATDLCDTSIDVVFNEEVSGTPECTHSFKLVRTWTATDCADNISSLKQTVTVTDDVAPVIVSLGQEPISQVDSMEWESVVSLYDIVDSYGYEITDNSGNDVSTKTEVSSVTYDNNKAGMSGCGKEIVYKFSASDECENVATQLLTVQVVDNTPPEFNEYPENVTIEIDETWPSCTLTVVNDCEDITVEADHTERDGNNLIRTWYAEDSNSNVQTHRQTVFVEDTTPPHLTHLPASKEEECDCTAKLNTWATLSAVDNDPANSSPTVIHSMEIEQVPGNYTAVKTVTHTWSATDAANNLVKHDQVITVVDTTPPKLVDLDNKDDGALPSQTISFSCTAFVPKLNIGAEDRCDADVSVVESSSGGSTDQCKDYEFTRTFTATDASQLSSVFTQTVRISDEEAPTCTGCNENMCLYPNGKSLTLPLDSLFGDRLTDNCSGVVTTGFSCQNNGGAGSCSHDAAANTVTMEGTEGGEYTITVTVEDHCGTSTNFSRTVNVFSEAESLTKKCLEATD